MIDSSLLKRVDIFSGLSEEQLQKVGAICREAIFQAGEIILQESEESKEMYIVAEGGSRNHDRR